LTSFSRLGKKTEENSKCDLRNLWQLQDIMKRNLREETGFHCCNPSSSKMPGIKEELRKYLEHKTTH
jgi:hypothetical protein